MSETAARKYSWRSFPGRDLAILAGVVAALLLIAVLWVKAMNFD